MAIMACLRWLTLSLGLRYFSLSSFLHIILYIIKSKTSSKKIDDASSHDHMIIYHVQSFTEVLKELQIFATKKNRKLKSICYT